MSESDDKFLETFDNIYIKKKLHSSLYLLTSEYFCVSTFIGMVLSLPIGGDAIKGSAFGLPRLWKASSGILFAPTAELLANGSKVSNVLLNGGGTISGE